jgi:hypothetical protein
MSENFCVIGAWIGLVWSFSVSFLGCIWTNLMLFIARNAPVLSVACNPETNTVVAGTELVSSQAVVAFW